MALADCWDWYTFLLCNFDRIASWARVSPNLLLYASEAVQQTDGLRRVDGAAILDECDISIKSWFSFYSFQPLSSTKPAQAY